MSNIALLAVLRWLSLILCGQSGYFEFLRVIYLCSKSLGVQGDSVTYILRVEIQAHRSALFHVLHLQSSRTHQLMPCLMAVPRL